MRDQRRCDDKGRSGHHHSMERGSPHNIGSPWLAHYRGPPSPGQAASLWLCYVERTLRTWLSRACIHLPTSGLGAVRHPPAVSWVFTHNHGTSKDAPDPGLVVPLFGSAPWRDARRISRPVGSPCSCGG
jgi:hypothetical protein